MFIRWTFAFDEGSLNVEVRDEKEDERILECMVNSVDWILIPTLGKDAYINLRKCKAVVREEVNEQAAPAPEAPPTAPTESLSPAAETSQIAE